MKKIEEIDSNFAVAEFSDAEAHIKFFDVCKPPFDIRGVIPPKGEGEGFLRMPREIAETVNERIVELNTNTSGGRIRFRTNSNKITLKAEMRYLARLPHMALQGSAGFDMYRVENGKQIFAGVFMPWPDNETGYTSDITVGESGEYADYVINMPLYSPVTKVSVGIDEDAEIKPCSAQYRKISPVVYYGSSITQGGCASRAGNAYQSVISRRLNIDFLNLGFSGNAKGEKEIADYIKNLDMSAFVYDYDYNAPSVEFLEQTHKPMFDTIRSANPSLPIIMISRPQAVPNAGSKARLKVIENTYNSALGSGDKNVYLIDGGKMIRDFCGNDGTVDNCHPTDFGFAAMAKTIGDMLEKVLPAE